MEGVPWMVDGDFNTFMTEQERRGSRNNRQRKMLDFADAINDCQLVDPVCDGAEFTWARGNLFERLDRVLLGEGWASMFASTRVINIPRLQSDHGPLLVRCKTSPTTARPLFRFQNMWRYHHAFTKEIRHLWEADTGASGMLNLQFKQELKEA